MTVVFADLFARLGGLFDMAETVRAHQDNLETKLANVLGNYNAATMHFTNRLTDRLQAHINDAGRIHSDIEAVAKKTLVEMMDADVVANGGGGGLERKNVVMALAELRRQMTNEGTPVTITRATQSVGATSTSDGCTGNGCLLYTSPSPRD